MSAHELIMLPASSGCAPHRSVCSCRRWEGHPQLTEAQAALEHSMHAEAPSTWGPPIVLAMVPVGSRMASGDPVAARPFRPVAVGADVERVMARLVGPVMFAVSAWLLLMGGAL